MSYEDLTYHQQRAEHCREMAQLARDPDVSRRHAELADLHASRAAGLSSQGGFQPQV